MSALTIQERQAKVKAMLLTCEALGSAIREAKSIPSGHLYAAVMGHFSIGEYMSAIGILKDVGLVKESNHLLTWIES